eukprot:5622655-Amphidinium_carterae.2
MWATLFLVLGQLLQPDKAPSNFKVFGCHGTRSPLLLGTEVDIPPWYRGERDSYHTLMVIVSFFSALHTVLALRCLALGLR